MADLYIRVARWGDFQHYKDRDPKWIKNYTRLLSDDAYLRLTLPQRGLLHGIWLEYARSASESTSKLPANTLDLSRRIGGRVLQKSLNSLVEAGFIEIVASNVLAERYQAASPEEEEELEKEPSVLPSRPNYAADPNGDQPDEPDGHDIDFTTILKEMPA